MVTKKFQGPVRPGMSERIFRATGQSRRKFQGPVRPGTDEARFRETGKVVKKEIIHRAFSAPTPKPKIIIKQPITKKNIDKRIISSKRQRLLSEIKRKQSLIFQKRKRFFEQSKIGQRLRRDTPQTNSFKEIQNLKEEEQELESLLIDPRTNKPFGFVEATPQPTDKFKKLIAKGKSRGDVLRLKKERGKTTPKEEAELLVIGTLTYNAQLLQDFRELPKFAKAIKDNPGLLIEIAKNLPSTIKSAGKEFGDLVEVSPGEAILQVGSEILIFKGTSKVFRTLKNTISKGGKGGKVGKVTSDILNKAKEGNIKIPIGKGKSINLKLVKKIPAVRTIKTITKATKQVETAIKKQAGALIKQLKKTKSPIIENALGVRGRKILSQFNKRALTSRELSLISKRINSLVRKRLLRRNFLIKPSRVPGIRRKALRKFKKRKAQPTFKLDTSGLKSKLDQQLARLKSKADIIIFDKKTKKFRIVESKPRTKKKGKKFKVKLNKNEIKFNFNQFKARLKSGIDIIVFDKKRKVFRVVQKKPRFRKKIKQPTFTLDKSKLKFNVNQLKNRLRSKADIIIFDKKTKRFKVIQSKPRFKKGKKLKIEAKLDTSKLKENLNQLKNRLRSKADIIIFDKKTGRFKIVQRKPRFRKKKTKLIKPSQLALKRFKKVQRAKVPKVKVRKPSLPKVTRRPIVTRRPFIIKIKPDKIPSGYKQVRTSSGQVLLQRTKQVTKQVTKPQSPIQLINTNEKLLQNQLKRFKTNQKLLQKVKLKQKSKVKQTQKQIQQQKQKVKKRQKQMQVQKKKIKQIQKENQKLRFLQKSVQGARLLFRKKQVQGTKPLTKQAQRSGQVFKFGSATIQVFAQPQIPRVDQVSRLKTPTKLRSRLVSRKKMIGVIKRKKKAIRRKEKKRKTQSYNVKARPLKKKGQKKKPKLLKVNKKPLTKERAEDLRNYISDTSLSRTAKIIPTKGKPLKSILRVPGGYAKRTSRKFRTYRIIKGKRVPLRKGIVIERRGKALLDTIQERRGITLRKRIAQLQKKAVKKKSKRKKRKITPAQRKVLLKNLKKARRAKKKR